MSKASNINSISALRERREEIKSEQEAARRGLTSTLANAPQKAKEYALEDLALPALGIGLAAYIGYRILRSKNRPEQVFQEPRPETNQVYTQRTVQGPSPSPTERVQRVQRAPRQEQARPVEGKSFDFGKLISAGKLLIPAAQAIIGVIQDQKANNK
jgi:hypothetical protein